MVEKIVIAGGSGFLGQLLAKHYLEQGYEVVILTHSRRDGSQHHNDVHSGSAAVHKKQKSGKALVGRIVSWHPYEGVGDWALELEGALAVINVTGANVGGKRWSNRVRHEILRSRVDTTRTLVSAIATCEDRPALISTSGSGFYGDTLEPTTEAGGAGGTFLADVCRKWEEEALHGEQFTRVVVLRLGVVLDRKEGIVARLLPFFRAFLGGPLGSGRQWLPWVHKDDVVRAFDHALRNERIEGVYNIASPDIVTMAGFATAMGQATGRPSWLRVPRYAVRLLRGRQADIILHGQHIVPMRTVVDGFEFKHRELTAALRDILNA